jgi:hypothetical protein
VSDKELKFLISATADQAVREFKRTGDEAKASLGEAETAVDGLEDKLAGVSAGKRLAAELSTAADGIVADLGRADAAADRLSAALGPEMSAQLGRSGVDKLIVDFKRAGLTFEDIEQDAEDLALAVRKLEGVGRQAAAGMDDIDSAARRVGTTTDNTRSVVANFAGNAVQELPGVGAAMGPMNMAIGQFAEYAAEGNIRLSSFVKAAGGLGVAGVVLATIASEMERAAKVRTFNKEQVEEWTSALRDGETVAKSLRDTLEESGKLEFVTWDGGNVREGLSKMDIAPTLAKLGLTIDDFNKLVAGGAPLIEEWARKTMDAGAATADINIVMGAATSAVENLASAQRTAAVTAQVLATETDKVGGSAETAQERVERLAAAAQHHADQAEYYKSRMAAAAEGTEGLGDEAEDAAAKVDKLSTSWDRFTGRLDKQEMRADIADGFDDIEQAATAAYDAASKGSDDAESKGRDYERQVREQKRQIAEYAEEVLKLPPKALTEVMAAIDHGQLAEAQRLLDALVKDRIVKVTANITGVFDGEYYDSGAGRGGRPAPAPAAAATPTTAESAPTSMSSTSLSYSTGPIVEPEPPEEPEEEQGPTRKELLLRDLERLRRRYQVDDLDPDQYLVRLRALMRKYRPPRLSDGWMAIWSEMDRAKADRRAAKEAAEEAAADQAEANAPYVPDRWEQAANAQTAAEAAKDLSSTTASTYAALTDKDPDNDASALDAWARAIYNDIVARADVSKLTRGERGRRWANWVRAQLQAAIAENPTLAGRLRIYLTGVPRFPKKDTADTDDTDPKAGSASGSRSGGDAAGGGQSPLSATDGFGELSSDAAGNTYHIHLQSLLRPTAADGRVIVEAIKDYERQAGKGWRL